MLWYSSIRRWAAAGSEEFKANGFQAPSRRAFIQRFRNLDRDFQRSFDSSTCRGILAAALESAVGIDKPSIGGAPYAGDLHGRITEAASP